MRPLYSMEPNCLSYRENVSDLSYLAVTRINSDLTDELAESVLTESENDGLI